MTRIQSILYILTIIVTVGLTVLVTRWVCKPETEYRDFTAQEIFEIGSGWQYTTVQQMGAYAWLIGLQDKHGLVFYLDLRYPCAVGSNELLGSKKWRAFLCKSSYSHQDNVEVLAGSSMEARLLEILEEAASQSAGGSNWLDDRSTIIEIVKTRKPEIFEEKYDFANDSPSDESAPSKNADQ